MDPFSFIWNEGLVRPLVNGLVLFYGVLGSNFGLSIIAVTLLTRVILYPLTVRQLRSTRAMTALQPRMKALNEKYKNDRTRLQREQMKLFKEAGVNPLGCLGPLILQMPILFAMFVAIRQVLGDTPESLIGLSDKLYSGLPFGDQSIPLNQAFIGMDLGEVVSANPAGWAFLIPVLTGASTWLVQRATMTPSADPQQQSTQRMMTIMFPLVLGFMTLSFPAGLAIYWISSNLVSMLLQWRISGSLGSLVPSSGPTPATEKGEGASQTKNEATQGGASSDEPGLGGFLKRVFLGTQPADGSPVEVKTSESETDSETESTTSAVADERGVPDGRNRNDGQNRRGGRPKSPRPTGRGARRRRGRRSR